MDKQRGSLLIDELPSVLSQYGDEFLHITIDLGERVVQSNLKEELLLGEAKFDPFAVMEALDKCPAIIAFWSTLLVELKERVAEAKRQLMLYESNAREWCSYLILQERPEGAKKMPSQAEVDAKYALLFISEGTRLVEESFKGKPNQQEMIDLKGKHDQAVAKLKELEEKASRIEIVYTAWRDRSYMLSTQASLMETLINRELIKMPRDRQVYEGWE